MEAKKYIVAIIGKEIFHNRLHIEQTFGEVLYDQIISVLEMVAEEKESSQFADYRLGVYLDSNNPGTRKFFFAEHETYVKFLDHFGHAYFTKLAEYSAREQKKGTDVLFQLNNGNLSMNDFEKKLNDK